MVVAGVLVVALLTAWVAGSRIAPPAPDAGSTDAVRLGPEAGEDVSAYLARVAAIPAPEDPSPRLALVAFDAALPPDAAAAALAASDPAPDPAPTPLQAVVRVPFPRVQTALHRVDLPPAPPAAAFRAALTTAAGEASADAGAVGDGGPAAADPAVARRVAVDRAEAVALARPDCACVIAVVVRADPAAITALRGGPGVRAVQAAPPDTSRGRLAVSPLLPDQGPGRPDGAVVGPVPDDGPVPAAAG